MTQPGSSVTPTRIGVVGHYLPRQLVFATNAIPLQLHGSWSGTYSTHASRLLGAVDVVTIRILTDLLEHNVEDLAGLVICNDSAANLRLFYVARMLSQRGQLPYPVLLLDCPSDNSLAGHRFIKQQYERLSNFLANITGTQSSLRALNEAGEQELVLGEALESLRFQRSAGRYSGFEALEAYLAVSQASHEGAVQALRDMVPTNELMGTPVFMTGSYHPDPSVYQQLEHGGLLIVGEDHSSGDGAWLGEAALGSTKSSIYEELATLHFLRAPLAARSLSIERAQYLKSSVSETPARFVVGLIRELDDAHVWDVPVSRSACEELGLSYHVIPRVTPHGLSDGVTEIESLVVKDKNERGTTQRSVTSA